MLSPLATNYVRLMTPVRHRTRVLCLLSLLFLHSAFLVLHLYQRGAPILILNIRYINNIFIIRCWVETNYHIRRKLVGLLTTIGFHSVNMHSASSVAIKIYPLSVVTIFWSIVQPLSIC